MRNHEYRSIAPTTAKGIESRPLPGDQEVDLVEDPYEKQLREYIAFTQEDAPQTEEPLHDLPILEAQSIIDSFTANPELAKNPDLSSKIDDIVTGKGYEKEQEAARQEQAAADAALEAKLTIVPNLRYVDKLSEEIHNLRNTPVTPENKAEHTQKLNELEELFQEQLSEYEKSPSYDAALANVLKDRTDMVSLDQAAKNALVEQREAAERLAAWESQKAAEEEAGEMDVSARIAADPRLSYLNNLADMLVDLHRKRDTNPADAAKIGTEIHAVANEFHDKSEAYRQRDLKDFDNEAYLFIQDKYIDSPLDSIQDTSEAKDSAEKLDQATDAHAIKQPTKMPVGPTLTEQLESKERTPEQDEVYRAQARQTLQDQLRAQQAEKRGKNVFIKSRLASFRDYLKTRERGRKGLQVAMGMIAGLTMAAGIAGALSGDKAPSESTAVDSGTNAPADPTRGTEPKPTPPPAGETKSAHEKLLESPAWNIPKGSGGEAMMNRLHVDKGIWYENEAEFQKKFPGEAYWMQDGHVGLRDPGALPMSAREFWATKIEQQK